jgi:hypothetical protein
MLFVRHAIETEDMTRVRDEAMRLGVETVQSDMPHGAHCIVLDELVDDPSQPITRPLAERMFQLGYFTSELATYCLGLVRKTGVKDAPGLTKELFTSAMSEPGTVTESPGLVALRGELDLCTESSTSPGTSGD